MSKVLTKWFIGGRSLFISCFRGKEVHRWTWNKLCTAAYHETKHHSEKVNIPKRAFKTKASLQCLLSMDPLNWWMNLGKQKSFDSVPFQCSCLSNFNTSISGNHWNHNITLRKLGVSPVFLDYFLFIFLICFLRQRMEEEPKDFKETTPIQLVTYVTCIWYFNLIRWIWNYRTQF